MQTWERGSLVSVHQVSKEKEKTKDFRQADFRGGQRAKDEITPIYLTNIYGAS